MTLTYKEKRVKTDYRRCTGRSFTAEDILQKKKERQSMIVWEIWTEKLAVDSGNGEQSTLIMDKIG